MATALPALMLAVTYAIMLLAAVIGEHPLWMEQPMNMSEAAALRDRATVVRLIRRGESPREARAVRAGFLFDRTVKLTPMEAAIAARRMEVVDLLLSTVGPLDPEQWNHLRCVAELAEAAETADLLDQWRPAGATMHCAGIKTPW